MSTNEDPKLSTRRLRRFYVPYPLSQTQGSLRLEPAETHHLRHLIRLSEGDRCLVADGQGWEAEAEVLEFTKDDRAVLRILEITRRAEARANRIFFRVLPALLQKGKTDILVEKAQELQVDELRPVTSDRCEVRIPKEKIAKTVERWRRIAVEASKQSGALRMVRVSEPGTFRQAVEALADDDALLILHPESGATAFPEWLESFRGIRDRVRSLNILIGPEGGFTDDEIEWVRWRGKKKNVWVVSLGEAVLRADTAFISVLGTLRFLGIV